ncbi:MAG: hypothetical protein LBE13_21850 [Bacteroidales bacterium]|jgi:hypothetical protein|nr:hypothetical protein [Bacteroidales bacterium]
MSLKIDNFVSSFEFTTFSKYLTRHQWINEDKYNEFFTIWHRREKDNFKYELIVPESNNIKYFHKTIEKTLFVLADFYNKTPIQVIDDFNNSLQDKVKYSLKSEMTKNGLIPLNEGIRLLDNTKEMIASSFLAVNKKKKNFLGPRSDTINDVLQSVELGQTEEGSFIINIYIPRDYFIGDESILFEEPSFTRKALTLMENATNSLIGKIDTYRETDNIKIFDSCIEEGVSSNFCHAISEISLNGQNDVVIDIEYFNGIDKDIEMKRIVVDKNIIPIINRVEQYFHSDLTEDGYEIKGFVTVLRKELDAVEGEITVAAWVDQKLRRVRMHLNPEQYPIAVQAHRDNIMLVCYGTLFIQDRVTKLLNVTDVTLEAET